MGSPGESQEEGQETDVLFLHSLQCDGLTTRLGESREVGGGWPGSFEALCASHFFCEAG